MSLRTHSDLNMGFSEKTQMDGVHLEAEAKKWVISGVPLRTPLKPIFTNPAVDSDEDECCTTPTSEEARIPTRLPCPPAPKKRKPSSRCKFNGAKEFFTPPDLETVFIRRVERA